METAMTCREFIEGIYIKNCSTLRSILMRSSPVEYLEELMIEDANAKNIVLVDIGRMKKEIEEIIYE